MRYGHFHLSLTPTGNLVGEFTNDTSRRPTTEAANRISSTGTADGSGTPAFVGTYHSVWLETGGAVTAKLTIRTAVDAEGIFDLTWFDREAPETTLFSGQGTILQGCLIGDYSSGARAVARRGPQ